MDAFYLMFMVEAPAFTPHTLTPTWPLARELYMRDNNIPETIEHE